MFSKVNFRHLFIHLLAIYLFQQGIFHFCFLTDIELLEMYKNGGEALTSLSEKELATRRNNLFNNASLFSTGGMILGLLASLLISNKRKWFWQNSLIAFAVFVVITNVLSEERLRLGYLFLWLGDFSNNLFLLHLVTGLFFLTIGTMLLMLTPIQQFIQIGQKEERVESFQFEDQKIEA